MATPTKHTRVTLRLGAEHKSLLEQAAKSTGLSLPDVILSASAKEANSILEQRRIVVSEQEFERFLAALEAETLPTEVASRAAAKYRYGRIKGDIYEP